MNEKHGMSHLPEHQVWRDMRNRCNNSDHAWYKDYGGRGIKVCEEWDNSFVAFINDMGRRPSDNHSIERIDNDKGYSKDNCKWATKKEQRDNQREPKTYSSNTSGYKGVTWRKDSKKWRVRIQKNKKRITIGYFDDLDKAIEARKNYKQ